jgi:putative tricarboxylic transport membrane protein
MLFFGVVGYLLRRYNYSPIAFLLGLILAPIAEQEFFKALGFAAGDPSFFVTPLSVLLTMGILISIYIEMRN